MTEQGTLSQIVVKHFNTSVVQHFAKQRLTTTCNAPPGQVVSSRTVNSFENSLDKHLAENRPMSELTGSPLPLPRVI